MFYLSGRGSVSGSEKADVGDEFGWYLEDREIVEEKIYENSFRNLRAFPPISDVIRVEPRLDGRSPLKSTITIITSNADDENSVNYSVPRDFGKRDNGHDDSASVEQIELSSLNKETLDDSGEIDVGMIENDAKPAVFTSSIISRAAGSECSHEPENETLPDDESRAICYTPERLVRSQGYRILTPSPRYLTVPRSPDRGTDDAYSRKYRGHRRKIGDLIDAKQFGASHLESLLDPRAPEIWLPVTNRRRLNRARVTCRRNLEHDSPDDFFYEPLEIANRESPETFLTPDLVSSRSSYEMGSSWEDRSKIIRRSSQEDTSGIHSSDWSADTPSGAHTPLCLCDELATVSKSFGSSVESKNRSVAINEVVSILEGLKRDPHRAAELLDEDRFCDVTSGHDHLTRLALAIEPDGSVPTVHGDPENLVDELRDRVERLQEATRNILRDIDVLRRDFECNENKVDDLIDATVTLRQDTTEVRYLDDILNLLDGELDRISRRNWPFVFGHEHPAGEMNLVI